jgi:hypothetical protein
MKIKNIIFGAILAIIAGLTYAECMTQTIVVNGKIHICTTCGKVTTCN